MDHEKLECYKGLVDVAEDLSKETAKWPRGNGYLVDELRRAMSSAVLNLAEGNAKRTTGAERRRFFEISMGSMAEVGASLDLALAFGLIKETMQESIKSRLKLAYVRIRALP